MSRLLIVDDDDLVRCALSMTLESFGHDVVTAASTAEALDSVQGGLWPDAVLADYRLKDHDTGVRAVCAVREALGEAVPAIILTGDTSPERLKEILRSGLVVLHKPVPGIELVSRINAMLNTQGPLPPQRGAGRDMRA